MAVGWDGRAAFADLGLSIAALSGIGTLGPGPRWQLTMPVLKEMGAGGKRTRRTRRTRRRTQGERREKKMKGEGKGFTNQEEKGSCKKPCLNRAADHYQSRRLQSEQKFVPMESRQFASPAGHQDHPHKSKDGSGKSEERTEEGRSLSSSALDIFLQDNDQCKFYGFLKILGTGVPCCCQIDNLGYFRLFDGTEFHELYLPNMKITAMDSLYFSMHFRQAKEIGQASRSKAFEFEAQCQQVREKWMSALEDSGAVIATSTVAFNTHRVRKPLPGMESFGDNVLKQRQARPAVQQKVGSGGKPIAKKGALSSKEKETDTVRPSMRSSPTAGQRAHGASAHNGLIRKTPVAFIDFPRNDRREGRVSTELVSDAGRALTPFVDGLFVIPKFPPSPVLLRTRQRIVRTSVSKTAPWSKSSRDQGLSSLGEDEKNVALKDQIDSFRIAEDSITSRSNNAHRKLDDSPPQGRAHVSMHHPTEVEARGEAIAISKTLSFVKKGMVKGAIAFRENEQELSPWTNEGSPRSSH
eukprot:763360-Hanusia_phi.AAC.7